MSRLRSVFGAQFGTDQARQLGLIDVTLQRLIARRLIALEAAELGLEVGKDQIRHRIMAQQEFRNQRGQFDRAIFENAIARNGMNEALYVESLRGEIARGHLIGVINAGGAAPSRLAETLYRYRNEKRTADVVEILRSAQPNVPEPDDAQLSAFHTENAARFTSPERRDATAIHLDPTDLAAEIRPPEESVRDEFENRLAALTVPERRRLRQIVVQDEATARKVSSSLKQGRAFADVAKELAGQAPASTNLGLVTFGDIPPEMADVAFKLGEKQSSQPISTPLGWHVLMSTRSSRDGPRNSRSCVSN